MARQKQRQFRRVWPPLCLATAAGMLLREGFPVRVLDNNAEGLPLDEIRKRAEGAGLVFLTSTPYDRWQCPSISIDFFLETARVIPPEKLFILGGHVTERPETLLRETGARAAILGEPEETIVEICRKDDISEGFDRLREIAGTAFLENEKFYRPPVRPYMADLDGLATPAFHLLPMERYHYFPVMGKPFTILESSRGCPGRCAFCYLGMYGRKVRVKSVARFLDEIEFCAKMHRVKNFYFMDLEFCLNRERTEEICRGILERGLKINWCCQTRVNDIDDGLAALMKKAGCSLIHFGVEAGNPEILAATRKGITVQKALSAVALCRKNGIRTAVFMNFGFPGETLVQMEETIDLAIAMNPTYASFHLIVPFPGTELAEKLGVGPEDFPPGLYPSYNHVSHELPPLKKMLHRAYRRFYLRPSYALTWLSDHKKALRSAP